MARVGNMLSGTCMREEGANSARGLELNDQIVMKGRTGKEKKSVLFIGTQFSILYTLN
jgi:hypothetical protein